jgi:hypothetical protein
MIDSSDLAGDISVELIYFYLHPAYSIFILLPVQVFYLIKLAQRKSFITLRLPSLSKHRAKKSKASTQRPTSRILATCLLLLRLLPELSTQL